MSLAVPVDPYSAVALVRGDYAADQAAAKSRITGLRDWDIILFRRPIPIEFAEATTASGSDVTLASFYLLIPEYAPTYSFQVSIESKVTAGTGTWFVEDDASTDASNEITVTGTGYADSGPATLEIGSAWTGRRLMNINGRVTGGTLHVRNLNRITARFID